MYINYFTIFGIVILIAGVQGLMKGSKASMIAAGILGGCVLVGTHLVHGTLGWVLVLVGSAGVTGKFLPAFLKAKDKVGALWPAGVLGIMGVIAIVRVVMALF